MKITSINSLLVAGVIGNQCVRYGSYKHIAKMLVETTQENIMWTTPAATEMRFGFEVTMYVMNK